MFIYKNHLKIIIGIFLIHIYCLAQNLDVDSGKELVVVDPIPIKSKTNNSIYKLIDYKERKTKWSTVFSLGYGQINLPNFETNFLVENFSQVYGENVPYYELQYGINRNFNFLALGFETGIGFLKSDAVEGLSDKPSLTLMPIKVGARLSFNSLFSEPYILPYISGGGYLMVYEEKLNSSTSDGNASVAGYYSAGLAFQLNWVDPKASRVSFMQYGLQNSFIYIEAKQYLASGQEQDPDFSSDPSFSAGLLLEL